jgi:hypothetical protein
VQPAITRFKTPFDWDGPTQQCRKRRAIRFA